MDSTALKALVDLRDRTLQKSRIAFGNRLAAVEQGRDLADDATKALLLRWNERFMELEREADKDIATIVKNDPSPIITAMTSVKGIGPILAAKVVSMVDIKKAETVSALWRYAGFAVVDGARERPQAGVKLAYNKRLKAACLQAGSSFMKQASPYRAIYDQAREHYARSRPEWTPIHQHEAAMRKMVKFWLAHVWEVWRELEGLPVRNLYAIDRLGHSHYKSPQDFGWRWRQDQ